MEDRSGELRQALDQWELCNDMPAGIGAIVRAAVEEVENINAEPMALLAYGGRVTREDWLVSCAVAAEQLERIGRGDYNRAPAVAELATACVPIARVWLRRITTWCQNQAEFYKGCLGEKRQG